MRRTKLNNIYIIILINNLIKLTKGSLIANINLFVRILFLYKLLLLILLIFLY